MSNMIALRTRIRELVNTYQSFSSASKAIGVTSVYLRRLYTGERTNPSDAVLRKLGLRRQGVLYSRLTETV